MQLNQPNFDIHCEWGENGVRELAPLCDVMIIVDVLSFSTSVAVAVSRGATIYPFPYRDETAEVYARSLGAELAVSRDDASGYSLSPVSLQNIPAGTRLVLPSPNGATLSLASGNTRTLAGCLRNANAVAAAAQRLGGRIAVIPAGERWKDGTLRPSFEDLIGAGAIIHAMTGTRSPEALAAQAAFEFASKDLGALLKQCASGLELVERGYVLDVEMAASLNVSTGVPMLIDGAYRNLSNDG